MCNQPHIQEVATVIQKLKPGVHMIATIAKKSSAIVAIIWRPLSSDRSGRSDNDR